MYFQWLRKLQSQDLCKLGLKCNLINLSGFFFLGKDRSTCDYHPTNFCLPSLWQSETTGTTMCLHNTCVDIVNIIKM